MPHGHGVGWRPRYSRTRSGCLTCRRRRKKCDETKPRCVPCQRNRISCSWPNDSSGPVPEYLMQNVDSEESAESLRRNALWLSSSLTPSTPSPPHPRVEDIPISDLRWSDEVSAFVGRIRAANLTPVSRILLHHYLTETSMILTALANRENPYVGYVLPLAYADDLLMHALLALSGSHLGAKDDSGVSVDTRLAAWKHYGMVVQSLRSHYLEGLASTDTKRKLTLLLVLLILCYTEAIGRNHRGEIFGHLKASRELILNLLQNPSPAEDDLDTRLRCLAFELYAYLAAVSNITPYASNTYRFLPMDPGLSSLRPASEFETTFASLRSLFELIPEVAIFSSTKLREEQLGENSAVARATLNNLLSKVESWHLAEQETNCLEWNLELSCAAEIYRHSVLIYIKASACGSVVDNLNILQEIQQHIDCMQALIPKVEGTSLIHIMLWPVLIAGSCLVRNDQKCAFRRKLLESRRFHTSNEVQVVELLDLLWEESDKRAYGPFGLHLIMKKHGINLCMC